MREFNIYLAGALSCFGKENFDKGNVWREDVKFCIKKINEITNSKYDLYIFNPNEYYNFLDNSTYDSQREIKEFELNKLRHSDLVIVNFNGQSIGTSKELAVAHELRIPIIGLCEESDNINKIHPWDLDDVSKLFTDKEEMLEYILNYYLN